MLNNSRRQCSTSNMSAKNAKFDKVYSRVGVSWSAFRMKLIAWLLYHIQDQWRKALQHSQCMLASCAEVWVQFAFKTYFKWQAMQGCVSLQFYNRPVYCGFLQKTLAVLWSQRTCIACIRQGLLLLTMWSSQMQIYCRDEWQLGGTIGSFAKWFSAGKHKACPVRFWRRLSQITGQVDSHNELYFFTVFLHSTCLEQMNLDRSIYSLTRLNVVQCREAEILVKVEMLIRYWIATRLFSCYWGFLNTLAQYWLWRQLSSQGHTHRCVQSYQRVGIGFSTSWVRGQCETWYGHQSVKKILFEKHADWAPLSVSSL